MLRIIRGAISSVAYDRVKKEIRDLTERNTEADEKRIFLLVPEQQSVIAETEIMKELPASASLRLEVTNFTRLADTVHRSLGGLAGEHSTRAKEALIMWKTLTNLKSVLTMTGANEINTGMVEKALAAVNEMKSISATPEALSAASQDPSLRTNTRLSAKLNDIAMIMTLYSELLVKKYSSARDECERLAEKLMLHKGHLVGFHFYISGFTSFTEPQYKVIKELIERASVTVHLPMSKRHRDNFEFTEIRDTETRLVELLGGKEPEYIDEEAEYSGRSPLLHDICDMMWRNVGSIDEATVKKNNDRLRIFEAQDPYEECDFIAADIKKRVMAGESFSDFAIISRDTSKYSGLIDVSLERAGISYFISQKKEVSSLEAIKLIYAAFNAVTGGFKRSDIISYAKCGLCGISADACDEFELYTEMWDISGERFLTKEKWSMPTSGLDRARDDEKAKERESRRLDSIDKTRQSIIKPLKALEQSLKGEKTVKEYATALYSFLGSVSLESKLKKHAELLRDELKMDEQAEICEKLWSIICYALDTVVEVLSDVITNTDGFINQFKVVLSEVDIGRIPAFVDAVTVGRADMIRLNGKKHVYIIGANAGEFPKSADTGTYFSAKEKALLSAVNIKTEANEKIAYSRELFFFSRAVWSARQSVTVTYSTRNEALGASSRSDAVERILRLCGEALTVKRISDIPISERLYFPAMSLEFASEAPVMKALVETGLERDAMLTSAKIDNSEMSVNEQTAKAIYDGMIKLSQTKIESYLSCPFAYYLKYNIRLSENEKATFDARSVGTFVHAVLEGFFKNLASEGLKVNNLTLEEREARILSVAEDYLNATAGAENETQRQSVLLDRLTKATVPVVNGICDELAGCKYEPKFFELNISEANENLPSPIVFDDSMGGSFVEGTIDRVDVFESDGNIYVRVVDYKTGQKVFKRSDLDDGRNLQMFLYLKAIVDTKKQSFLDEIGAKEGARVIPGGVIYTKTDVSDASIDRPSSDLEAKKIAKMQTRQGMILDDRTSIDAMNPKYIPVTFNKPEKKGELPKPSEKTKDRLYTLEDWDTISKKMEDIICGVTRKMRSGNISLAEDEGGAHCDSCKFKAICRRS